MTVLPAEQRDHAAALHVLRVYAAMLDELGATWWIDYGTVLGAARTGGMIAWDSDIDIGVMAEDQSRTVALGPLLREHGFDTCYHRPGRSLFGSGDWFHVVREPGNPNGVDTFFWHRADDGAYRRKRYAAHDRWKGREFPPQRLLPLQRIEWEGVQVWAPADIEWFAAHRYGESWRVPVRSRDYIEHLKAQKVGT